MKFNIDPSTFSTDFFEAVRPILSISQYFTYSIYRSGERIIVFLFRSVAIATYVYHRLIMEKEEIDNCFPSQYGYFEFHFTKMFID